MAGRKPKPTTMKKLEGNPGKRKLNTNEPVPAKGMPDCPEWYCGGDYGAGPVHQKTGTAAGQCV